MDDAIWALLQRGTISAREAFMKAIDKTRFKAFLPPEEEHFVDAAGAVRNDDKNVASKFSEAYRHVR